MHAPYNVVRTRIAAEMRTTPSALELTERSPASHQSNRLYDLRFAGKHLIVKEYLKPDEFADAPYREFRALTLLHKLDLAPVPVALLPESTEHGPLVIYAFMDGAAWDRHPASMGDLQQMADAWVTMNAMTPHVDWRSRHSARTHGETAARFQAFFRHYHTWAGTYYPPAEATAARCLALVEQRRVHLTELVDYDPPLRFCRADPRFANVIRRPDGRIGFVDWEDSGLTDPAIDIADLMTHPNQEDLVDLATWQAFSAYYAARTPVTDPHLERRIALYNGLFSLFWIVLLVQAGMQRHATNRSRVNPEHSPAQYELDWSANGMPVRLRLQRLLARALAWPALAPASHMEAAAAYAWFP